MDTPFSELQLIVGSERIDINGHMNSTQYGLIIYEAHDLFCCALGFGPPYVEKYDCGTVVLESHMRYEREVFEGDKLTVRSWLLAVDEKRMHYFHELMNLSRGFRAATSEQVEMHFDLKARKSAAFPKEVGLDLQSVVRSHLSEGLPENIGSTLRPPINAWL